MALSPQLNSLLDQPGVREATLSALDTIIAQQRAKQYYDDPVAWIHDCIAWREGEGPTIYQDEVIAELPIRKRVALRGPHGLGKTAEDAWIILWFALTRDAAGVDWKIPTTASAWRQLTHYLWPEIHKWSRRLNWERIGRPPFVPKQELLDLSIKLKFGEAFALASDDHTTLEGAHAEELLYLFDEAKTIPAATFDAAEGAFSNGVCMALANSTPGEPQGRFYDIHQRKPGYEDWWVRAVSKEECIAAGRMSEEWAEQRRQQWGEGSAVYINRVLGNFAASEEDGVIPLSWVEAANDRWRERNELEQWGEFTRAGCDIARSGSDVTVFALRHGPAIRELRRFSKQDTMETTGLIAGLLSLGGEAVVDLIGIGAGVYDRLEEQGLQVRAFNASERTDFKDRSGEMGFVNKRSAAWWNMREMLDPASGEGVALPPDDLLTGDLTAPKWRVMSGGKIQVESKDDIKKRLGRSTDDGDAVVMAFWPENVDSWVDEYRLYM